MESLRKRDQRERAFDGEPWVANEPLVLADLGRAPIRNPAGEICIRHGVQYAGPAGRGRRPMTVLNADDVRNATSEVRRVIVARSLFKRGQARLTG